jgi:predicted nucleic acid-binding protein
LTVVADAGPLIALAKIDGLEPLFRLYPQVSIPPAVHDEAIRSGRERGAADAFLLDEALQAGRLKLAVPQPNPLPVSARLGRGEEETILLAIERRAEWASLDDLLARGAAALSFQANRVPTRVKGTLGVIVSAFQAGHLSLEEAVGLVSRINARPDIWIHDRLCRQVIKALQSAGL